MSALTQDELNLFVIAGEPKTLTFTGVLSASIVFKRRGGMSLGNMIAEGMAWDLLKAGRMTDAKYKTFFYPPSYYVVVPGLRYGWRRVADDGAVTYVPQEPVGGDPHKQRQFIWSFAGRPAEFDPVAHDGATVTVKGRMIPWANGLGAKITRPAILELVSVEREPDERPDAEIVAGTMSKINEDISDLTGKRITLGPGK